MIALAKEELEHFEIVVAELRKRNIALTPERKSVYAKGLHKLIRENEPHRLLDSLIVGALIEARSCERFSLLSKSAVSEELRALYRSLLASEAGHYRMYTDLAREYFPSADVKQRIQELAAAEAGIVRGLKDEPVMHG
jgi:tRNA 2-(methylsulfanyl)-N6-isopentenyladenosine37 hydroxylase